jgi:hypothetical protein
MPERDNAGVVGSSVSLGIAHLADNAEMIFFTALSFQTYKSGYGAHVKYVLAKIRRDVYEGDLYRALLKEV